MRESGEQVWDPSPYLIFSLLDERRQPAFGNRFTTEGITGPYSHDRLHFHVFNEVEIFQQTETAAY